MKCKIIIFINIKKNKINGNFITIITKIKYIKNIEIIIRIFTRNSMEIRLLVLSCYILVIV